MTTLASFLPNMGQGLHLKTYKVGGVYRKPVSGRKRAELIREVHDPTPKKWELRTPKGVKHDAAKIKRLETIQKNLKSVARQMPDRLKKHPKRGERVGHQWFKPSFEQKALKYFRDKSIENIDLKDVPAQGRPVTSYGELFLHLLRATGTKVAPADQPKLLQQLKSKTSGAAKKEDGAKDKKKKKTKEKA